MKARKVLSMLLVMLMVLSLFPATTLAGTSTFQIGNGTDSDSYDSLDEDAMNDIKTLSGDIVIKLLHDYNGTIDFQGQVLLLDLNGNNLQGEVENAQNVTVTDQSTGAKGKLAATGTYMNVESGLVDETSYVLYDGTYMDTVSLKSEQTHKITYKKVYNGIYGGDNVDKEIAVVYVNPGDSITLMDGKMNGIDINVNDGGVYYAGFKGWTIDEKPYSVGAEYTPSGDTEIATAWAEYHKVTYHVEDPTNSTDYEEKDLYVLDGNSTTLWGADLFTYAYPKYTLSKWISPYDGTAFIPGTEYVVESDLTLIAKFVQSSCDVKYVDENGEPIKTVSAVAVGKAITLNGINELTAPEDSVFDGWLLVGTGKKYAAESSYTVEGSETGEITFKATWKAAPEKYTVTYYGALKTYPDDKDSGNSISEKTGISCNETITLLGSAAHELLSEDFIGWLCMEDNILYDASADFNVTADTDFVAVFKSDKLYKVTYNLNGGTYENFEGDKETTVVKRYAEKDTVLVQDADNLTAFGKTGYTFKGWQYDGKLYKADGTAEGGNKAFVMPANDVTLTAVWDQMESYTVSYNLNGGTYRIDDVVNSEIAAESYEKDAIVTVSNIEPQKDDLVFLGWKNSVDNLLYKTGGNNTQFAMPAANVTLTAEFAKEYTVDFVVSVPDNAKVKGSDLIYAVVPISPQTVYDGQQIETVKEPDPYDVTINGVRTTFYFAGWKINETDSIWDFAEKFDSEKHPDAVTHKLTLTALWSTEKHYTVVFKDKITDMFANGDNAAGEEAQYVLYNGKQLYKCYEGGVYSSSLILTSVSEKDTIGNGNASTGENKYPVFTRVDYTLGDNDQDRINDWYVIDSLGSNKLYYDASKSLKDNFGENIDNYADSNGVITLWANWNYKYAKKGDKYQVKIDTTKLADATYAEYYTDYIVATTDPTVVGGGRKDRIYRNFFLTDAEGNPYTSQTHSVSALPDGLYLNKLTGEIYGVPKETGTFTFYVKMESDARVEAAATEGAQPISAVYPITITINALPISVDRINNAENIYDKTYGDTDTAAYNVNDTLASKGKTYVSDNLTVTLGKIPVVLAKDIANVVDSGKANVTLNTNAVNSKTELVFAYTDARAEREAQIERAFEPSNNNDWLACVDIQAVNLDTVFRGFTDTVTCPVVRTDGEDAGKYKLSLTDSAVTYAYGAADTAANATASDFAPVYKLMVPEAFSSENVDGAAAQYVFTINPVQLTLSLRDRTYTKTYGENDPVYPTNDLTAVSTDNEGTMVPKKSTDSTALTLTYPCGFTDTLIVSPTRVFGEDVKDGYALSLTIADITTDATDKADKNIAGNRTGADVKANYTFNLADYTNNKLAITKRPLTFIPDPSSSTYGELKPGDALTGSFETGTMKGLANNEDIGVVDSAVASIVSNASNAGYLEAADYTQALNDGKKISFVITNDKWVNGEENSTTLANTADNYNITATLDVTKADTLNITGNNVKVKKGTKPTEDNIKALATLSGALVNGDLKDDVTLKVTKYTADVDKDDVAEDYVDANDLIDAIGDAGLTADLTVTVTYAIEGDDKDNYSLPSGKTEGTLVAYTYNASHSGSGGGGGSSVASYTVKFDTNGGSEIKNISVKKGQTIGTVTAPTKDGYVFTGWYSDKELTKKYDDETKVTAATTLYAGWKVDPARQLILTIGNKDATVFGQTKSNDVAPKIVNDRTMLPARFVAENLGAKVDWNEENQLVTITGKNLQTGEDVTMLITIGGEYAVVNGENVKLDSPAFVENDRTYTPVRFISEQLGADVEWDEATQQVIITKVLAWKEK